MLTAGLEEETQGENMETVVPRNRELSDLLSHASSADLEVLADLITDNGKGRIALSAPIKTMILARKEQGTLQTIADVLESEIRAFGGNTLRNLIRSGGVEYRELAEDVARKLGGKPAEGSDVFAIEAVAVQRALETLGQPGADGEARSSSRSDRLTQIVASLVAGSSTLMGLAATGGTAGVATAIGGRLAALALPPLAVAATAGAATQAAAPAFRITVPAVLQIAKIRQARFDADFAAYSEAINACM